MPIRFRPAVAAITIIGALLIGDAGLATSMARRIVDVDLAPVGPAAHLVVAVPGTPSGTNSSVTRYRIGRPQSGEAFYPLLGIAVGVAVSPRGYVFTAQASRVFVYFPAAFRYMHPTPAFTLDPKPVSASDVLLDAQGNLFVGGRVGGFTRYAVAIYTPPLRHAQKPLQTFVVGAGGRHYLALDSSGELYVSRPEVNAVDVYATPLQKPHLVRSITGLAGPTGIALDASDELYVANGTTHVIDAFPPTARGPAKPDRTISTTDRFFSECSLEGLAVGKDQVFAADGGVFQFDARKNGVQSPVNVYGSPGLKCYGPTELQIVP